MSWFCTCGRILESGRCIECREDPKKCCCEKLEDTRLRRDNDLDYIIEKQTGPLHH